MNLPYSLGVGSSKRAQTEKPHTVAQLTVTRAQPTEANTGNTDVLDSSRLGQKYSLSSVNLLTAMRILLLKKWTILQRSLIYFVTHSKAR